MICIGFQVEENDIVFKGQTLYHNNYLCDCEQQGHFYSVCTILYLDEAKLRQLSVE